MGKKQKGGNYTMSDKLDDIDEIGLEKIDLSKFKLKKFEELSTGRKVIGAILLLLIAGIFLYSVFNWDNFSYSYGNITYPDGCVEYFERGELVSSMCENGRALVTPKNTMYDYNLENLKATVS